MATTEKETAGALDTDLIQLDAFLRSDNAPPECMMLSDLDGFLTGIAVGPERILPSEWLPVVWGEAAATFANETQARIVLAVIMGHYNQILRQIDECAPQPILWRTNDGTTIASDWAKGFAHAIALRPHLWKQLATSEAAVLLTPIMLLCSDEENGRSARLDLSPEEMIKTMEEARHPSHRPGYFCLLAHGGFERDQARQQFVDSIKGRSQRPMPMRLR